MAAIENLEIVVDVDISSAIADLQALQEELEAVAREISSLRREGRRGFTVKSNVEHIEDDLTRMSAVIEAWEQANSIDIGTNVGRIRGGGGGGGSTVTRAGGLGVMGAARQISSADGLGEAFQTARQSLNRLAEESSLTNINMADMHNVLARLVPILLVFIGAIPAAVAAIYTLAAAAATAAAALVAMAAFGAIGFALEDGEFNMQNLSDAFEQVRRDFLDAFGPLAERLQPLFEDGLAGLERFFDAVADEGDALMALTDEARAFGGFVIDFVPEALRTLAALVASLSHVFAGMGESLDQNFTSFVRDMVNVTAQVVPVLADFANTLGRALPAIIEMSLGFLMVADAALNFLGFLARLVSLLGISPAVLGVVTASLLALISAFALGSTVVGSFFVTSLINSVKSLYMVAVAANAANVSLLRMGKLAAIVAIGGIYNVFYSALTAIPALLGMSGAAYTAASALAALLTIATLGAGIAIVGMALSAASGFMNLAGSIDSATRSLKDFRSVQSGMGGSGFDGSGSGNPYGYDPDDPDQSGGSSGSMAVFNVESSGDPDEDRSNLDHADWMAGRTTG